MPIESSVTLISDLNASYPENTDSIPIGANHLRNVKTAVKSLNDSSATKGAAQVGFLQQGTGASTTRKVQDKLRETFSVKDFGAVGDNSTDDTTSIQNAITAAIAASIDTLVFPPGTYKITSALSVTTPLIFRGAGPKRTVIRQATSNANGVVFDFAALVQGGGFIGLSIEAGTGWITAGFQGSGSTGIGVRVQNSNGLFFASNFGVANFDTGISCLGSFYSQWCNGQVLYATTTGVLVHKSSLQTGAGNLFADCKVSNNGFTGTNTASYGIRVTASGGDFFRQTDVTSFNKGISLGGADDVLYCFFGDVLADTCLTNNWEFDGSSAKVWSIGLKGCWASFSTNGAGIVVKGSQVDSIKWNGGRIRENGTNGVNLQGGVNVEFIGAEISSNSKLSANTHDAVLIDAGVSQWRLVACRIGNIASTLTGHANNISIAAGASENFSIIGCDLRGQGAGKVPLSNGSTSLNYIVRDNLPRQTVGTNTTSRMSLTGGSAGTPAAGATVYIGLSGSFGAIEANPHTVSQQGVVTGFRVAVTGASGAGQTYTYTVYKNAVATSMTGTISGAAAFSVDVGSANAFTASNNDRITLELVTSAGAALSIHNYVIFFEI